jgi:hypothetical protein
VPGNHLDRPKDGTCLPGQPCPGTGAAGHGCCDTRSHVVSELVEEVWLMPET